MTKANYHMPNQPSKCVCVKRESTRQTQNTLKRIHEHKQNTHIHLFVLTIDICKVRVNLIKFMG